MNGAGSHWRRPSERVHRRTTVHKVTCIVGGSLEMIRGVLLAEVH